MDDSPLDPDQQRLIRYLRRLVTTLTVVMIGGLIIVIGLLVTRFPTAALPLAQPLSLPDTLALPDGTQVAAFTRGRNWIAVVSEADEILILSPDGQTLRQTIRIAD